MTTEFVLQERRVGSTSENDWTDTDRPFDPSAIVPALDQLSAYRRRVRGLEFRLIRRKTAETVLPH